MRSTLALLAAWVVAAMAAPAVTTQVVDTVEVVEEVVTVVVVVVTTVEGYAPTVSTSASSAASTPLSQPVPTTSTLAAAASTIPSIAYSIIESASPSTVESSSPSTVQSSSPSTLQTLVQPTTAARSTGTPTSSAADSSYSPYSALVVAHHNAHRANHSSQSVVWDDDLAATAQLIADSCYYAHNVTANGGGYGQNIAAGVPPGNITAVITNLFYNGEMGWYTNLYGEASPSMTNFDSWGHFSQIVWNATTKVGCATSDCTAGGLGNVGNDVAPYFTVCNYGSPGNVGGEYGDNIFRPIGDASLNWNSLGLVAPNSA